MSEHRFQEGNQYAKGHGRPKGSSRSQICKTWAETKGFAKLIQIAESEDPGFRIHPKFPNRLIQTGWSRDLQFEAVKLILAYGVGKPTEFVDVSSGGKSIAEWAQQWFGAGRNGNTNGHNGHGSDGLHPVSGEDHS